MTDRETPPLANYGIVITSKGRDPVCLEVDALDQAAVIATAVAIAAKWAHDHDSKWSLIATDNGGQTVYACEFMTEEERNPV